MLFSTKDKLMAVRREIQMRRGVYPKWVEAGKMTEPQAKREIAIMEEIAADLEARLDARS